jgi:hypothetical protein
MRLLMRLAGGVHLTGFLAGFLCGGLVIGIHRGERKMLKRLP